MVKQDDTGNASGDQPAIENDLMGAEAEASPLDAALGMGAPHALRGGDTRRSGADRAGDTRLV